MARIPEVEVERLEAEPGGMPWPDRYPVFPRFSDSSAARVVFFAHQSFFQSGDSSARRCKA